MAVRAASVAARAGKAGQMAVKAATAVDRANTAYETGSALVENGAALAEASSEGDARGMVKAAAGMALEMAGGKKADGALGVASQRKIQEKVENAVESIEDVAQTTSQHSAILRKNLEADGRPVLQNEDAAHIVASGHPRHEEARGILDRSGIGIDDAINGGGLPSNTLVPNPFGKTTHNTTHRYSSMDKVTRELRQAEQDATVHDTLRDIESRRQSGSF